MTLEEMVDAVKDYTEQYAIMFDKDFESGSVAALSMVLGILTLYFEVLVSMELRMKDMAENTAKGE